ncbi:MAG TPA: choice-of-anchor tandem repeat GloVer-containing protein, partial [Clostridia bacterium]|nr:choice-of-anchor tandem repeat GloVer-containing protein [Clostridia bacterium]
MKVSAVMFRRLLMVCTGFGFVASTPAQLHLKVLHSYSGDADGQQPNAGLVQGTDGVLYGTTYLGGSNRAGTIFKVNPDGSGNTPIYQFEASTDNPFGLAYPSGLIQGTDGALYGTTGHGGTEGYGSVF